MCLQTFQSVLLTCMKEWLMCLEDMVCVKDNIKIWRFLWAYLKRTMQWWTCNGRVLFSVEIMTWRWHTWLLFIHFKGNMLCISACVEWIPLNGYHCNLLMLILLFKDTFVSKFNNLILWRKIYYFGPLNRLKYLFSTL